MAERHDYSYRSIDARSRNYVAIHSSFKLSTRFGIMEEYWLDFLVPDLIPVIPCWFLFTKKELYFTWWYKQ